jgi:hypothetical protein
MKHTATNLAITAAAVIAAASCAGAVVRDEVADPALASTWSRIRVDALAEIDATNPALATMILQANAAMESGDDLRIAAVRWDQLGALAIAGIQRSVDMGALHPGVASSLTERVNQFLLTVSDYISKRVAK